MPTPSIKRPLFLGFVTILALWLGWTMDTWAAWAQSLLVIVGIWTGCWLAVVVIEYVRWSVQVAEYRQRKIDLMTEEIAEMDKQLEIIRAVRMLDPKQIDMISNYGPIAATIAGDVGPLAGMQTFDGSVPYSFVDLFLARSSGRFLAAVGEWSEGTAERDFAVWLTKWLIERGMADTASGPYPARWRDGGRALAIQAIYRERINNRRERYENGNAVV